MYRFGKVQQKILLALMGGVALGFCRTPQRYYKTLGFLRNEWGNIDQRNLKRSIAKLSDNKLVTTKKNRDGSLKLVLTKSGKREAAKLNLLGSSIKLKNPKTWDRKWRIVIFDIPETDRLFRDILRTHLYELNFYKLQHSVFASPYPYEKPLLELIELYSAEKFVRVITAEKIDNEKDLKKHFFKSK